jgi:hypothetical protein
MLRLTRLAPLCSEAKGIAANDLWEEAIEASLSFANETQLI